MSDLKSAYFHCIGGVSGDMLLGAVVDAGVSVDDLNCQLAKLGQVDLFLSAESSQKNGVHGTRVFVNYDDSRSVHVGISDFVRITQGSSLPDQVVDKASRVFERLAKAESLAHGVQVEDVHLHELGTLDTLVDVIGSILGLDMLGVGSVYSSPLPTGSGVIGCEHGNIPAFSPVAATLVSMVNAPIIPPPGLSQNAGEMVTPTGVAILTTIATFTQPTIHLEKIGYGLGDRESHDYPNVLGLWIGEEMSMPYSGQLKLIETNIDDMNSEHLSYAQERLFAVGAKDVWFTPIQMKKSRPATMLSAIVDSTIESHAVELILRETSSLGVRVRSVERYEAERCVAEIETSVGTASVKIKRLDGATVGVSPEYEDCRRIALDRGMPLQDVYRIIQSDAVRKFLPPSAIRGI